LEGTQNNAVILGDVIQQTMAIQQNQGLAKSLKKKKFAWHSCSRSHGPPISGFSLLGLRLQGQIHDLLNLKKVRLSLTKQRERKEQEEG
jgi:hypothetical protein